MARRRGWGRRRRRWAQPTLRITALVDVVFLVLTYFLLSAEFRKPEVALPVETAQIETGAPEDPLALPERPILIFVRSTGDGADDADLRIDAPELAHVGSVPELRRAASSALGPVFATDQPFLVRVEPGARWEHAMRVAGAIESAGYERIRFDEGDR